MGSVISFSSVVMESGQNKTFDLIHSVAIARHIPSLRLCLSVPSDAPDIRWLVNLVVVVREQNARPVRARITQVCDDDPRRILVTLGNETMSMDDVARQHLPRDGFVALISCGYSRSYPLSVR